MGKFFSMENPFFQGLYKVAQCVMLTLVWLFFCIPLFTAGTSTAALYYTAQKCLKYERGYIFSCYWGSFKENFKTGTAVGFIFLIVVFAAITDLYTLNFLYEVGVLPGRTLFILFAILFFLLILYFLWVFAVLARFKNNWKGTMINAFRLAVGHWKVTLMMAGLLIFTVLVIYIIWPLIFLMPAVCIWLMSAPIEKVFRLYMQDEDKRMEDELNMDYHNDYSDSRKPEEKKKRGRKRKKEA